MVTQRYTTPEREMRRELDYVDSLIKQMKEEENEILH